MDTIDVVANKYCAIKGVGEPSLGDKGMKGLWNGNRLRMFIS